jgi:hypothetical protein
MSMNETSIQPQPIALSRDKQVAPQGIGMAVAFDWGLAVQMLLTPILTPLLGASTSAQKGHTTPLSNPILSFVVYWLIALLFILFGEGIRSGVRWTRWVQIVGNTLGFLGGFVLLVPLWNGIKTGNYWTLAPATILLIFSPLIAWRLSRPQTARWFATVARAEGRKRHGGIWIFWIALWAIAGGTLVVLSGLH